MKRRISLLLVIALLVSMVHLPVTAAGTQVRAYMNVDGAYFTCRTEGISFIPGNGDKDVRNEALGNGDLGSIFGLGYRYFHIEGWVADDDEFGDFGYSINGGDIVWGAGYSFELDASATGYAYCLRYNLTLDVQEGDVTIKFFKMLSTGETRESKTLTYSNEAAAPVVDHSGSHADTNIQVGEALLEADFSDSVLDSNQFVAWVNGYTIQNGALHLGYNGTDFSLYNA